MNNLSHNASHDPSHDPSYDPSYNPSHNHSTIEARINPSLDVPSLALTDVPNCQAATQCVAHLFDHTLGIPPANFA